MTLIITCQIPEYVIQVSDRRLTRPDGSLYDDETNKAVFYLPGAVFSYTGLAEINGIRTDEWLTSALKPGLDLQALVEDLKSEATRHFSGAHRAYRHIAIVGAFWVRTAEEVNQSGSCLISNYYGIRAADNKLGPLPDASDEFQGWISLNPPSSQFSIFCAGQPLTTSQICRLKRFVRRYLRNTTRVQRSFGTKGLCRHLSHFVRSVAEENRRVGKSLMQTLLPNPRIPEVAIQRASFSYMPADADSLTMYAPNLVNPSMSIMGTTFRQFRSDEEFRKQPSLSYKTTMTSTTIGGEIVEEK